MTDKDKAIKEAEEAIRKAKEAIEKLTEGGDRLINNLYAYIGWIEEQTKALANLTPNTTEFSQKLWYLNGNIDAAENTIRQLKTTQ